MTDQDLSGTVLDGRYKVISPISEGAMGSVYRGERIKLGRAVAIKVMHEALPDELSSRQRFEREAKLMAMLEHPNCVSVIDFGVHDDKPFLVMELVRGTSLQAVIEKQRYLEIPRAADIVRQVLSGLGHAHELGIIHRDIKPANIMVSEQSGLAERVRILDFGLARLTDTSTKLTTGIVVGTPNYMAPEQCKGGDLDGRTDLYACGVMLFELLTGRKPFVADDPIAVVRKHISEPPPRLADIAPGADFGDFEAVVARALAKNAADRFESAEAMSQAIDAALKKGAAQVFARAVPSAINAPPGHPQLATPSGWNVPAAYAPPPDSLSIPVEPGSAPVPSPYGTPGSAPVPSPYAGPSSAPVPSPYGGPGSAPVPSPYGGPGSQPAQTAETGTQPVTASQIFDPGSHPVPSHDAGPGSQPVVSTGPGTQPITASQIFDPGSHPVAAPPVDRHSQAQIFDPGPQSFAPSAIADAGSHPTPRPSQPPSGPSHAPSVASQPPSGPSHAPSDPSHAAARPSQPGIADPAFTNAPPRALTDPHSASMRRAVKPLVSRKQFAIAGGGLIAVIVVIAIVAGRGHHKAAAPTGDAAVAQGSSDTAGDPVPALLARANDLAQGDDLEAALSVLTKARKQYPDSAPLALAAGKLYFGKLWWTDGIKEFRDAIRIDPSLRSDPELLKTVLRGFITTPDVDDRIESFVREDLHDTIRPYLEETAKSHPNKQIRARAQAELRHLR